LNFRFVEKPSLARARAHGGFAPSPVTALITLCKPVTMADN
jgi:hypothetical protein